MIAYELARASFLIGNRIDYRVNTELARIAREAQTLRRSMGQHFRKDRKWITDLFSIKPTTP